MEVKAQADDRGDRVGDCPIVRLSAHLDLLGAHHVVHIVRVGQLVGTLQVRGRQAAS